MTRDDEDRDFWLRSTGCETGINGLFYPTLMANVLVVDVKRLYCLSNYCSELLTNQEKYTLPQEMWVLYKPFPFEKRNFLNL